MNAINMTSRMLWLIHSQTLEWIPICTLVFADCLIEVVENLQQQSHSHVIHNKTEVSLGAFVCLASYSHMSKASAAQLFPVVRLPNNPSQFIPMPMVLPVLIWSYVVCFRIFFRRMPITSHPLGFLFIQQMSTFFLNSALSG
jgi:hypothetical protein